MELSYESPVVRLYQGDSRNLPLEDGTVSVCVTSPPYLGLRRYSDDQELVWDEPPGGCEHVWRDSSWKSPNSSGGLQGGFPTGLEGGVPRWKVADYHSRSIPSNTCSLCGAWRGAFGLEPHPDLYIRHLMVFMDELWRVLRADGCVFVNIGDSMAGSNNGSNDYRERGASISSNPLKYGGQKPGKAGGIRAKSLMLIPERFALACQERGWIVRSRIVWAKPNPMPESVRDRPSDAWEHIWMLTKSPKYYWDALAVAELAKVTANVLEYQYGHEAMQDLFTGTLPDGVLPPSESGLPFLNMQDVRQKPSLGMEENRGGEKVIPTSLQSLARQPKGEGNNRQTGTFGEAQVATEGILPEPSRERRPTQGQYLRERAFEESKVLPFGTGAGSMESENSTPEDEPQYSDDINGQGVGGHQEALQDGVRLLRAETRSLNQRPYNPSDEGRQARQGEHPSRLPKLQYSQKQPYPPQQPTRNLRNFWVIPTEPYPDAHFAVFPTAIPEKCILASCPPAICKVCGVPRERIVEHTNMEWTKGPKRMEDVAIGRTRMGGTQNKPASNATLGWSDCGCGAGWTPGLVLDPFSGSGTTAMVAQQLGRRAVGVDLSAAYTAMAIKRLEAIPLPMELNP